jgi:hypothetical protein
MKSGRVNLWSRNGLTLNSKFSLIADGLKKLKVRAQFWMARSSCSTSKVFPDSSCYRDSRATEKANSGDFVFDLLYLNGEDLMRVPLVRR